MGPARPPDRVAWSFDRVVAGLFLVFAAGAAIGVLVVLFAAVRPRIDPAAVPAGRVYWTIVVDGRSQSTIECPSPWQWVHGEHDPFCQPGLAGAVIDLSPPFALLAIFAVLAVVFHLRRRSGRDRPATFGRSFLVCLVLVTVVPVMALLVATAAASPTATAEAIGAVGAIGIVGWSAARFIARRGVPRHQRKVLAVLPPTTDLRPLRPRRLDLLLPSPLVVRGTRGADEVVASLASRCGAPTEGFGSTAWVATEPLDRGGIHVTVAQRNRHGRSYGSIYVDGELTDERGAAELRGWLRRHPVRALTDDAFAVLAFVVGGKWIVGGSGAEPAVWPGLLVIGIGVGIFAFSGLVTSRVVNAVVATVAEVMDGEAFRPRRWWRWPGLRRLTTEERRIRRAQAGLPLLPTSPEVKVAVATAAAALVAVTIVCLHQLHVVV